MKVSMKHIFGRQKSFARNGVFTTGKKKEQGKEFWHLHYICFGSFAFKAKGQWIVLSQRLFIDLSVAKIRQETGGKLSVTNLSRSHSMKATTTTMKEVHRYVSNQTFALVVRQLWWAFLYNSVANTDKLMITPPRPNYTSSFHPMYRWCECF